VGEHPVGGRPRGQLLVARREGHRAARRKRQLAHARPAPLLVAAIADHELHLIVGGELGELAVAVAPLLARAGRLDVDDLDDARIDLGEGHGAAGLERDAESRVTHAFKEPEAALLRERPAAGPAYVARAKPPPPLEDRLLLPPLAAVEGIGRVAVLAAQRAAGEAHEHGRYPGGVCLALQGMEDLGDL